MHRLQSPETDIHLRLRQRLGEFGILAWRLSADGRVLEPPPGSGVRGTWVCNQCLIERLEASATQAAAAEEPARVRVAPGCEALLLPVKLRRRVAEWTAAMFLTPELLASDAFTAGCGRVHVDPIAAAKALRPIATFSPEEIGRLCRLLPFMAADMEAHHRHETTISGFTTTLTEAYEQIELTHRLAGQMRQLDGPTRFLQDTLDGILAATGFTWTVLFTHSHPGADGPVRPTMLHAGRQAVDPAGVRELLARDSLHAGPLDEAVILGDPDIERLLGEPDQLVAFPIHRGEHLVGVLLAGGKEGDDPQVSTYDTRVIDTVGAFIRSYYELACLLGEQRQMFLGSLHAITAALDAKDSYTQGHSERVAYLASRLAAAVGMSDDSVERIHIAGLLHDVGKIGVPEAVLRKPGKLTDEEFGEIKRHPGIGRDILRDIPKLDDIIPGVLWHHERWDGRGYPDGLAGADIPTIARVLAVADCFDAMSSNRSYRPALPRDKVLAEIARVAGSQLDPDLAAVFVGLDLAEYDAMVARHKPQQAQPRRDAA